VILSGTPERLLGAIGCSSWNVVWRRDIVSNNVGIGSVVKIVIEFCPSQERVIVRGVFFEDSPKVPLLAKENIQNHIKCFFDVPLSTKVGFAGLSVEEVDNVE
jgi:hypothetical protein